MRNSEHLFDLPIVTVSSSLILFHTLRCFYQASSLQWSIGLASILLFAFHPKSRAHMVAQILYFWFADVSVWTAEATIGN